MSNNPTLPHGQYSIKGHFGFGLREGGRTLGLTRLHVHRGRVDWQPESADPALDPYSGLYCDDAIHHGVWMSPRFGAPEPALLEFARLHLLSLGAEFQELAPAMVRLVAEHPAAAGRWPRLTASWRFDLDVGSGGAYPRRSRLLVRQTNEPGYLFLLAGRHYAGEGERIVSGPRAYGADGKTSRYVSRDLPEWAAVRHDLELAYGPAVLALLQRLRVGRPPSS